MFRIITPIILIIISIAGFITVVAPLYDDISSLKSKVASYNQALNNSKSLENERDKLTKKFNSIDRENLEKVAKLLPNNVDNIRLILEVEKIASPYGMVIKDVRYDIEKEGDSKVALQGGDLAKIGNRNYGVWELSFSTEGSYDKFLMFVRDLESNLRLLDIMSVQFVSNAPLGRNTQPDIYKYAFTIRTYWLKN